MSGSTTSSLPSLPKVPSVSVVMPILNGAAYVERQMAALAGQSYAGPVEVLVVDNGSTDDTVERVEAWCDRLPGLRVLSCVRPGANAARNAGLDEARGEVLALCDADDQVLDGWLENLVGAVVEGRGEAVAGSFDEELLNDPSVFQFTHRNASPLEPVARFLPRGITANLAVRTDVARQLRFNESYRYGATDTEFCWRLQLAGYRLGWCPEAVVAYRHRSSLRAVRRKAYLTGRARVMLYRDFRRNGMPRSSTAGAVVRWVLLVLRLPLVAVSGRERTRWVRDAAAAAGRLRGSVAFGVRYL